MDRDSLWRHRSEFGLRPYVSMGRENANPCFSPTVRLPHVRPLSQMTASHHIAELPVSCTAAQSSVRCPLWVKSDIFAVSADVRFTPNSDQSAVQQKATYSITS